MTQPDFVPLQAPDRVRPSDRLSMPTSWVPDRPGDLTDQRPPTGDRFGSAGPDMGYGLKLAKRFHDRITVTEGEDPHDAVAGCFACGGRRAASFGRAPVIFDMEWAYSLWGFLGTPSAALVSWRRELFKGAGHHYWDQRTIVDHVGEVTLRLTPAAVAAAASGDRWAELFVRS